MTQINPWGVELFRTIKTVQPKTPSEEAAYGKWLDETSDREAARIDRIHGAVGVIPTPLWVVLLLISVVVFVFMLFFADRGEGAVTQAVLMGSVTTVVVSMLLLIAFLDSPFHKGVGGVRPVAMERTLRIIDEALQAVGAARRPALRRVAESRSRDGGAQAGLGRGRRHGPARVRGGRDRVEQLPGQRAGTASRRRRRARVNKTRLEAARASGLANAQQQVDVATFMQWVDSYARDETELVNFYRERFRPEFKPAFERVDRDEAARDRRAPRRRRSRCRSTGWPPGRKPLELDQRAEELSAQVRRNIQRASNYVLGVVLFAVALFFAGMSTKLTAPGLRKAMLVVGYVIFVGTVVWIATSPISVAV